MTYERKSLDGGAVEAKAMGEKTTSPQHKTPRRAEQDDPLDAFHFGAWRSMIASMPEAEMKLDTFREAAADVAVQATAGRFHKSTGVDYLVDLGNTSGLIEDYDLTVIERIIGENFDAAEKTKKANGHDKGHGRLIQTNAEFVSGFVPPDYLIDGLIQRRFLYAITSPTGGGKTSIALLMASLVATGNPLGTREVAQGKVLFLAGENPDDARMRWIKTCELRNLGEAEENVHWVPGRFSIGGMRDRLLAESAACGPFVLIIIDSAAAFFPGDDENSNTQHGNYARMLRALTDISGGPAIIVLCHPVKNFSLENLLPRGGGAFLNELDGNLVAVPKSEAPKVSELHWHGKHRGPDFAPITFKMTPGTSERLKDSKGRTIWTVSAALLTAEEVAAADDTSHARQERLIGAMRDNAEASLADLAEALQWFYPNGGEPNKTLVYRTMLDLQERTLVKKEAGHWALTKAGKPSKAKPKTAAGFKVVGKAEPGAACVCCSVAYGDVLKIKRAEPGAKAEPLHEACASAWFNGAPETDAKS